MKKSILTIIFVITAVILSSCSVYDLGSKDKIVAPTNNIPTIEGKWIIKKSVDIPYRTIKEDEDIEDLINQEALFHSQAVVIGDKYTFNPSYKIRNVDISDYLLYKFKTESNYLGIEEKRAEVINIFGNDQYFYELIRFKDDEMIIYMKEKFFFLKRVAEKVSEEEVNEYINMEKKTYESIRLNPSRSLSSGVLLGIKSYEYDELNQVEDWKYKTLWIRADNRSILSIDEVDNLLVPRQKGFWSIYITRENINGNLVDKINSTKKEMFKDNSIMPKMAAFSGNTTSVLKNILYVGNDYISTEVIDKHNNKKMLQVYPIDYLEIEKPIIISDIIGESDMKFFRNEVQDIFDEDLEILINEESFGLTRRNGYWTMRGRVNYNLNGEELYKDYNIKTIPPKELVNYDELAIPWSKIKASVPNAIDAFTSPNEDIIIVETSSNILIYGIRDNEILEEELGRIEKKHFDSIVMAEWATDKYTEIWEEEILRNKTKK